MPTRLSTAGTRVSLSICASCSSWWLNLSSEALAGCESLANTGGLNKYADSNRLNAARLSMCVRS
ncbi:hypothetical protein D3C81_2265610 [compost metagenome]